MRVARFLLRRARAQLGTLLTLLVLAATVAAILAGTIGYTRAAGVSTVRSTLVEAPAREAGIQVQTRLADDPDAQDAAVRATLSRLLGPDLAVSRGLWTEPLGARAGQEELRVVLAEPVADVALAPGQVLVPEQVVGELPPGATLEVRGTALEVAGTWHPTDDRAWFADPMVAAGTDGSAVGPLLADPGTVTELTDAPFVRWTVYPDPAALTVTDLPALATGLADLDFALGADDAVAVRGLTVTGGLAQTVADLEEATRTAAAVGLVPVALLGVISLVALVQVVRLLGQARARETEILVARGASPRQVTVWSTAELVVVALVGSAVGTVLAAVVVGRLDGGAAQRSVIAVSGLTVAVLTVVTGAVVTGTQARAIARRMVADRSGRVRGAAAAGTVVLTAAAAVLSAWQLLRHGTPLIADGGADALAVVSLGAVLAALAVLALALLGPLTRLIARVRERERGLVGVLAARQVSRRVRAYAVPLVLVVLAVGATTVASSFAGATTVQRDHVAALATGADVRVTVPTGATSRPAEPRALSAAPYAELPGVAGAGAVLRGSGTFGELPVAVTALDTTRTEELMRVPEQVAVAGAAEGLAPDEAGIALPAGAQSLEVTVRAHLDHSASARETRAAVEAQYREYLVRLEGLSEEEAEAALAEQRARLAAEVFAFAAAVWVADEDGALSMLALDPLSADPDGTDGVVGPEPAEHILRVPLPGPGKYRVVALDVELTGPQTGSDAGFEVVGVAADGQDLPLGGTPWQLTDALGARDVPVEVAGTLGVRAGLGAPPEAAGSFGPLVGGEVAVRLVPAAPAPVPAVVNAALATAGDLTVGDTATVDLAGARVDLTVVAVADAVPGGLEEHALLVDLAALGHHVLARQANPVLPGQVWVTVADDAAAADVAAAARDLAGREAEVEIAGEGMGDSAASVRQAFWIVAAGAVLLALTGVAAVVLALARERRSEVMVLRALGLPPAGQARTRTAELLGVGALGTVLGVLAGWAAAALLVPTLARAAATQSSPLPLGSRFDLLPALGALAALAAGLVAVAAAVAARVRAQALDARSGPVALILLVLLVAGVVTAWPRLLAGVDDRQTTHEISGASPLARDVVAVLPDRRPELAAPEPGTTPFEPAVEENLGGVLAALEELRAAQPEPLRSMLGDPQFWVETVPFSVQPPPDPLMGTQTLTLKQDPQLADHVELVAGRWPEPPTPVDPYAGLTEQQRLALSLDEDTALVAAAIEASGALEVALSAPAADILQWEVGTERRVIGNTVPLLLTGTFEATDPDAGFWAHNPSSAEPHVVDDLNLGTSATAAAYVHPAWDGTFPPQFPVGSFRSRLWYPLQVGALSAQDVAAAATQLTRFTAPQELGTTAADLGTGPGPEVRFATELGEVLQRIQQQQAVTSTVLSIVAAGPLGVTLAVFLLAARLLVTRRRSALALLAARGGSGRQLRSMLALEGLVLALPAAAAGAALAVLLLPGRTAPSDLVLTGLVALVPAATLAATPLPGGLRGTRTDLGTRRSRRRWIAEVALLAVTAAALVLLLQRGVVPGTGETDVLLTAVPLLLAAATCVVVMRVYPLPVRALAGVFRRRRGVTAFLGSARAVRDPAGGLTPAVALVIGVSVAMFSAVLSSTIDTGVQTTAWREVGADIRLTGPVFDAEHTAEIAAVPGVAAVAAVGDAGTVPVSGERVDVTVVDPDAVRAVQADAVGIDRLPDALAGGSDAVPAVLSAAAAAALGAGEGDTLEAAVGSGLTLEVVGVMDRLAGAAGGGGVVVPQDAFTAATGRTVLPRTLLVAVADGADTSAVLDRIREVEPVARAQHPAGDASNFLASPMAGGMNAALTVAVVLSLVLVVVAVVMTQLMGAPARVRLLAVLRTLGVDRRQARGIVAWELAPLAVVSVAAGAVLGVLVPWVVLGGMDLRALTGGEEQPALVVDPLVVGGVLGGVLAVTALAVLVATATSSRADLAGELRIGEDT